MTNHVPSSFEFPSQWAIPAVIGITVVMEGFALEYSVVMLAAGIVTGMRVGISMLLSAAVLYFILTPWLLESDLSKTTAATLPAGYDSLNVLKKMTHLDPFTVLAMPRKWGMWTGTAILVFASLTSVAMQWKSIARAFGGLKRKGTDTPDAEMAAVEVPGSWMKMGLIPITIALIVVQSVFFGISWWLGLVAVGMSFVVALVCCRATGETDTTPIGAMGKVTQLLYSVLPGAHGNSVINLTSAGLTSAAGSSAADLLTDLKSGYLLGANPRKQFIAQFSGVFFGTAVVVPFWYLLYPTKEALEKAGAPAATMWKATADLLADGIGKLPQSAIYSACIGALLGILLPLLEKLVPRTRNYLPSTMGLGLGLVMPFANALSFFIGGLVAWVWSKYRPLGFKEYAIAIASGLISGGALVEALSAILKTTSGLLGKS